MIKNIFICGKPGCGKTSLIKEILNELKIRAQGFFTEEIRKDRERIGFKITTLNGKEGILAHINVKSHCRVGKYRVNIEDLEEIGVEAILDSLKKNKITVIDELGKMELFSEKFKKAVEDSLNSKSKVLGTIALKPNPFCDKVKKRQDTKVFYLMRGNREIIKKEIKKLLK